MDWTLPGFEIGREQQGTTTRVIVVGELDLLTAPQLREACTREQRNGAGPIVLDLSTVTFMDSTGLHALLDAHQADSDRLRIILSPAAARIIDISGLRDCLPIIEG